MELYNWSCLFILAQYDGWGHKESDRLSPVYSICFWYSVCPHYNSEMCFLFRFFIQKYCLIVTHQILQQPRWEHSVHRPWSPAQRRWRNLQGSWCRCSDNTAWCSPWGARQKEIILNIRLYTRSDTDFLLDPVSCTIILSDEWKFKSTVCANPSIFFSCQHVDNYTVYPVIPNTKLFPNSGLFLHSLKGEISYFLWFSVLFLYCDVRCLR